jgi:hypothetical protein
MKKIIVNAILGTLLMALLGTVLNILTNTDTPLSHLPLNIVVFILAFTIVALIIFNIYERYTADNPSYSYTSLGTTSLIIKADKTWAHQVVYLLLSDIWHGKLAVDDNPETQKQFIEQRGSKGKPTYGTEFRNLEPGAQYMLWSDGHSTIPVTLSQEETYEIELPPRQQTTYIPWQHG